MSCWKKPENGWIAVNVDGSSKSKGKDASCGGVLRDYQGNWIVGFQKNLGECNADEAEAWAVLLGLKVAWKFGYSKITIQSDSANIVRWINDFNFDTTGGGSMNNILSECKNWMMNNWEVNCYHVLREQNQVAHWLATKSGMDPELVLLPACPHRELDLLIQNDIVGVPCARGD